MIIASIIIVNKNQKSFLKITIPTLLNQKIEEQFEIIVVDLGSMDGAKEYVKKIGNIELIEIQPENFNYAHAFNTGAAHAKGKYLVRLSGDCIPQGKKFYAFNTFQVLCPLHLSKHSVTLVSECREEKQF